MREERRRDQTLTSAARKLNEDLADTSKQRRPMSADTVTLGESGGRGREKGEGNIVTGWWGVGGVAVYWEE